MKIENNFGEWIAIAEVDFSSARHLFETHYPKTPGIVCFHAQQATEKMLKGFFVM